MSEDSKTTEVSKADETLLTTIREDFSYVKEYWRKNHEESAKDMDCVACIPPPEFTQDRAGRPCIWPDEISQYVKQANNNLRQNKRAAKLSPRSDDATDEDAEHRQAYIRGIEYASKAQSIYSTAFESAVECGFGYWRVTYRTTGPNGEKEPRLVRIPNQFSVYPDPDAEEADFSDSKIYFILGPPMREKVFLAKYPKAKKRSFSGDDREKASDWFSGDNIVVAEYWTREESEEKDGEKRHTVTQYITNGVEILEKNAWIGSWIPIVGVFGEEVYVKSGGKVERTFFSLVRRARPMQQQLAYIASQCMEEFGEAPRAPLQGYKGQFNAELHATIHRIPRAYIEYDLPVDWPAAWGAPPLPGRSQFIPNIQAYEEAYERVRRSIMAAMGIAPLPTSAQRQNEKSGVALEKIQNQEAIGSYHFTDNFVRALCNSTTQVNELITRLAQSKDLPKQVLGKDDKDEDMPLQVTPEGTPQLDPESEHLDEADQFFAHRGQFEVTISDGPSYASQREEAVEFSDTVFKTVEQIAQILPQGAVAKLLSLAIKMKNIGPIGDEMAEVLDPKDNSGQQLMQAQQQLMQAQKAAQDMQAEIQKLQLKEAGHVVDNEYKKQIRTMELSMEERFKQLDASIKMYVANVTTQQQDVSQRLTLFREAESENHQAAHETAMQAEDHAHEQTLAVHAAANAQVSQASDQDHQQSLAEQQAANQPSE